MDKTNTELYDRLYAAFMEKVPTDTAEEKFALHHLSVIASDTVAEYVADLEEAIRHHLATIREMKRVDTRTAVS